MVTTSWVVPDACVVDTGAGVDPAALFELGEAGIGIDVKRVAELDEGKIGDEDEIVEVDTGATET